MMKKLTTQFVKYFIAAGAGYLFDFSSMIFFKEVVHLNYLLSASIGFVLGLTVVYVLSHRYVFSNPKLSSRHEFLLFTLIGLVGLGTLDLFMWILTGGLHIDYIISKIIATIAVYMWNFFARRALYYD